MHLFSSKIVLGNEKIQGRDENNGLLFGEISEQPKFNILLVQITFAQAEIPRILFDG